MMAGDQKPSAMFLRFRAAGAVAGDSDAERRLARFCADVASGKVPDPDYLRLVGDALQHFLAGDGKMAARAELVGKALGLSRKQGKAVAAQKDWRKQAYPVVDYLVNMDTMPEADAVKAAATKHGIGERAMRDRIRKWIDEARQLRALDEQWQRFAQQIEVRLGSEKET